MPSFKNGHLSFSTSVATAQSMGAEGDVGFPCGSFYSERQGNCDVVYQIQCGICQMHEKVEVGRVCDGVYIDVPTDVDEPYIDTQIETIDECNYYVVTYRFHTDGSDVEELSRVLYTICTISDLDNPYYDIRYEYIDNCNYYQILVLVHTNGEPEEEISAELITNADCSINSDCQDYFTEEVNTGPNGEYCISTYINNDCFGLHEQTTTGDCFAPPPVTTIPKLYITVGTKPEKYYTGSIIPAIVTPGKSLQLKVTDENGVLNTASFNWNIKSTATCPGTNTCSIDLNSTGTFSVKVFDAGAHQFLEVFIAIYSKSTVIFQKKTNYTGEYGFDDVGWQYDSLKNDFTTINIDTVKYHVPWMSLLPEQGDTINIAKALTPANLADATYWVEFRPDTSAILINGSAIPLHLTAKQLDTTKKITIKTQLFDTVLNNFKQRSIYVISNTGDTLGKINISCKKPSVKKIVFVYVNKGTGYRFTDFNKDTILHFLNKKSQNQIFKEWKIKDGVSDTLDLSYEYATNPSFFTSAAFYNAYVGSLFGFYNNHKSSLATNINYDINGINYALTDSNRVYFFFITDIPKNPLDSTLSGITSATSNSAHAVIFESGIVNSKYSTTTHELGHCLYLDHTFNDGTRIQRFCPAITKYTTDNFMDYWYNNVAEKRNRFYLYQWLKSN
jgi:hypothetical protein